MKTKTLLFILLLFSAMVSAQVKRVAILETVDKENKVDYAYKLLLRSNLSKAITNTLAMRRMTELILTPL